MFQLLLTSHRSTENVLRGNSGMKNVSVWKFRYEKCSILQGTFTKKKLIGMINLLNEKKKKKPQKTLSKTTTKVNHSMP